MTFRTSNIQSFSDTEPTNWFKVKNLHIIYGKAHHLWKAIKGSHPLGFVIVKEKSHCIKTHLRTILIIKMIKIVSFSIIKKSFKTENSNKFPLQHSS